MLREVEEAGCIVWDDGEELGMEPFGEKDGVVLVASPGLELPEECCRHELHHAIQGGEGVVGSVGNEAVTVLVCFECPACGEEKESVWFKGGWEPLVLQCI